MFVRLEDREFSMLGLSVATLERTTVDEGDVFFAQTHGPDTYTMGSINHTPLFGKVVYSGSTAHGYSGAPYIIHKKVLGMHLGYGSQNIGVASAFLAMKFSTIDEASEDILMKQIATASKRGKKIEYRLSPGDPEEVEFKWGKGYRILPREEFFGVYVQESALITQCQDMAQRVAPATALGNEFVDSKNGSRASTSKVVDVGALGQMSGTKSSVAPPPAPRVLLTHTTTGPSTSRPSVTVSPSSTPAPQRNRSDSIASDISYQPERKSRRRARKLRKTYRLSEVCTDPGQQRLDLIN